MTARHRGLDAAAGFAAAAVALGAAELAAGLLGAPSVVSSVGNVVVDRTPGPVVKRAIEVFGTADKPVLLTTVVGVSLAIGAALGPLAGRDRRVGTAAFAVFGLVAVLAGFNDPLTGALPALAIGVVAAVAGWLALRLLLNAAAEAADPGETWPPMPGRGVANRRRFLAFAGAATGGAALAALTAREGLGTGVDVEEQREEIALPDVAPPAIPAAARLEVEGISPIVTPNEDFYRIDTALVVPRVDVSSWRLKFTGMVDAPYELTFDELAEMASIYESVTLTCVSNEVGGNLIGNAQWLGVPLAALLERAGVQEGATQIVGRSVDGFTAGFPTEVALDGRPAMVAIAMNGEPLPAEHGFPARLVVPGLYGYVSATKWLSEIELTTLEAFNGYWIPRGWSKDGPIKTQSRIDVPRRSEVNAGRVPVAGVAWGGLRSVSKVEVRIAREDAAPEEAPWQEARLSEALTQSSWRQWVLEWDATPGEYSIEVRATDGEGVTQTDQVRPPAPDGATGYHRRRYVVSGA